MNADIDISTPHRKWYEAWGYVWRTRSTHSFRTLLKDPQAGAFLGFVWAGTTTMLYSSVATTIKFMMHNGSMVSRDRINLVFQIPTAILSAIIGLGFYAGLYHFIAKLLKGKGGWGELVYCFSAIESPLILLAIPVIIVQAVIPSFLLIGSLLFLVIGLYSIVMMIRAIDAVEKTKPGMAEIIYFTPLVILLGVILCMVIANLSIAASGG